MRLVTLFHEIQDKFLVEYFVLVVFKEKREQTIFINHETYEYALVGFP